MPHPRVVQTQQALPWHVGVARTLDGGASARRGYDELSRTMEFTKKKQLSVITSDKTLIAGHRQRIAFVRELQQHFGKDIDVFGRGGRFVEDKWDAIHPYRYHITIENSTCRDYFTEKIADVFLAGSYPLYFGCSNLAEYFPHASFTSLDIRSPATAIATIETAMEQNLSEERQVELAHARNLVLNRYNLFAFLADFCTTQQAANPIQGTVTLQPETQFSLRSTLRRLLRRWQ